jgi:putative membrane protein
MSDQSHSARDAAWTPPMELDLAAAAPLPVAEEEALLTDNRLETLPTTSDLPDALPPPPRRIGRWLVGAVAGLLLVAVGLDTSDLLARAFAASAVLGLATALLVAGASVAVVGLLIGEGRALRRLRRIEALRGEAERLSLDQHHGAAARFAGALTALYAPRVELKPALVRLRDHVTDAHDDGEIVRLLDRELLTPLDRLAYHRVLRAARDTAVATALSPSALLDLAVVLWRNLNLVREIAALYGARPGYFGSLRLTRRMLANIAVAGLSESAHHVAVEALGGSIAAAISTRMGQGVINGLLTARVGLTAMHLCRPIAFGPDNQPSLNRIRKELLMLPKQVL